MKKNHVGGQLKEKIGKYQEYATFDDVIPPTPNW